MICRALAWWALAWSMLALHSAIMPLEVRAQSPATKQIISPQAELAAKAIQVPDGFSQKTVASEPNLANGVAFCFDPIGRIFIAETYRVGKGIEDDRFHMDWLDDDLAARTVEDRRAYLKRHLGERYSTYMEASEQVRLLEDRDSDGLYEVSSIFSDDYKDAVDGTGAGVLWSNDRLLFTCIPSLWELRDTNGDQKADQRRALTTGYGVHTAFYGHDLHGLTEGPDGKIYFSIGDRGLNVETPDGNVENHGSGAVLRCNPDGSQLELFATGLRNPQELAFNELGDLFTVDNNSDGGDKARLVHVVEGMDAGWRMSFQYLTDRGPFNREKIWHTPNVDQPASIVPPLAHITDGPSGLVHYPGTGLPKEYDGSFFVVDFRGAAATSNIREFKVEPSGATYRLTNDKPFITGVLATDCDFAPNGDFYILDWVEGWSGPGTARIHRISSNHADVAKQRAEAQASLQKLEQASTGQLISFLDHKDMRVRLGAQRRLVEKGGAVSATLVSLAENDDAPLLGRIHAIWALGQLAERVPNLFDRIDRLCSDKDPEIRAQAARTLGRAGKCDLDQRLRYGSTVAKLLGDSSLRVRGSAALSIASLKYQDSLDALLQLAGTDGDDPTLRHAVVVALAQSQRPEQLLAAADEANDLQRLALSLALGKQQSPLVANFLNDKSDRIVLDTARIVWDRPIAEAFPHLASLLSETRSTSDPLLRRVLAANVAGRSRENLQSLIRFACRPGIDRSLQDLAWDHVRPWAAPSARDPVNGDWRPLKAAPESELIAELTNSIAELTATGNGNPSGLIIAGECGIGEAYPPLLAVVGNESQPEHVRSKALAAFAKSNDEQQVHKAIDAGIESKSAAVRSAARTLWAKRFPNEVVERLSETLETATMPERQASLDTLAKLDTPAARVVIREWMQRLEAGKSPPELQVEILEAAGSSNDDELLDRQRKFIEKLSDTSRVQRFIGCLSGGNAESGRKLFASNETLACRRCHSVKPGEVLVGPCLANIGNQRKPEELLESIVSPNVKMCEGFETTVLQLDTGKVVTGIVRRENDEKIELIDAAAKTIMVDPKTIEDRIKGSSAMPENLVDQMTPRQLRDIIAYLSELRTSTPSTPQPSSN